MTPKPISSFALNKTRSNILKTGTRFDAQKQFLANIEDAIASPVDIPSLSLPENTAVCIHTPGLRVWDWALSVAERHGTPSG